MREISLDQLQKLKEGRVSFVLYVRSELKRDKIKEIFDTDIVVPELEKAFGHKIEFFSICADENMKILEDFRLPSLVIFKNGECVEVMDGIKAWNEYVERFISCL